MFRVKSIVCIVRPNDMHKYIVLVDHFPFTALLWFFYALICPCENAFLKKKVYIRLFFTNMHFYLKKKIVQNIKHNSLFQKNVSILYRVSFSKQILFCQNP